MQELQQHYSILQKVQQVIVGMQTIKKDKMFIVFVQYI
jgi:hypothetical protein